MLMVGSKWRGISGVRFRGRCESVDSQSGTKQLVVVVCCCCQQRRRGVRTNVVEKTDLFQGSFQLLWDGEIPRRAEAGVAQWQSDRKR